MSTRSRLRWAVFASSVISTVDNPDAHLWRALASTLHSMGHEAVFYEPRGNAALRALLQRSGSRALSEFRLRHPEIEYRTLEPRSGADLVVWMTRTLATADVALIQSTASSELVGWLAKLTRPHLQTFFVDSGWNRTSSLGDRAAELLSGFSAVIVGDDRLVDEYQRVVTTPTSVHSFGPLPRFDPAGFSSADVVADLTTACGRLIDIVTAMRGSTTAHPGNVIGPNGRHL